MFPTVTAKLGNMRKVREWIVLPRSDGQIMVQADGAIGAFDFRTGKGRLNTKGEYFAHLAVAQPFEFPQEFVTACLKVCPSLGGTTEVVPGVLTIVNTVTVL
jgi:hypothetical protein